MGIFLLSSSHLPCNAKWPDRYHSTATTATTITIDVLLSREHISLTPLCPGQTDREGQKYLLLRMFRDVSLSRHGISSTGM